MRRELEKIRQRHIKNHPNKRFDEFKIKEKLNKKYDAEFEFQFIG